MARGCPAVIVGPGPVRQSSVILTGWPFLHDARTAEPFGWPLKSTSTSVGPELRTAKV